MSSISSIFTFIWKYDTELSLILHSIELARQPRITEQRMLYRWAIWAIGKSRIHDIPSVLRIIGYPIQYPGRLINCHAAFYGLPERKRIEEERMRLRAKEEGRRWEREMERGEKERNRRRERKRIREEMERQISSFLVKKRLYVMTATMRITTYIASPRTEFNSMHTFNYEPSLIECIAFTF